MKDLKFLEAELRHAQAFYHITNHMEPERWTKGERDEAKSQYDRLVAVVNIAIREQEEKL